jgi:hypothetical protein
VSSLISEWEDRARGGEERSRLELPEESDPGRGRRASQEFQQVRQKFVVEEGGGQTETVRQTPSFVTSCKKSNSQGRGAMRKLLFSKKSTNILSSVVGLSKYGKRKFDSDRLESFRIN